MRIEIPNRHATTLAVGDLSYEAWEIGFQRSLLVTAVTIQPALDIPQGIVTPALIQRAVDLDREMGWESPGADWSVSGYVPTDLIQDLFNWMFVNYGAPRVPPETARRPT